MSLQQSFLDEKEVAERVFSVVKNFEKVSGLGPPPYYLPGRGGCGVHEACYHTISPSLPTAWALVTSEDDNMVMMSL